MGSFRPGPTCVMYGDYVDEGTKSLSLSPTPIPDGLARLVVRVAVDAATSELNHLGRRLDETLEYTRSTDAVPQREAFVRDMRAMPRGATIMVWSASPRPKNQV